MEPIVTHERALANPPGYLLSICIPTYNRADILDQCIKSLISQPAFDHRVELVIVDNCSSDNTPEVVSKYLKNYPNLAYYRNDSNIGMEKNIIKVLTCGKGKLLKVYNDYCIFNPTLLDTLLQLIDDNADENSILFFKDEDDEKIVEFDNLDTFFSNLTFWPTWISLISFWKNDVNSFTDTEQFEGLLFPHLLMLLKISHTKPIIKVVHKKLISSSLSSTKGGYNFFKVFIGNFVGIILTDQLYKNNRISAVTLKKVKKELFSKYLKSWIIKILTEKSHNFDKKNFSILFEYYGKSVNLYTLLSRMPLYFLKNKAKRIVVAWTTQRLRFIFKSLPLSSIIKTPITFSSKIAISIGEHVVINAHSKFEHLNKTQAKTLSIVIGDHTEIAEHCNFFLKGRLKIGSNVSVGKFVTIHSTVHSLLSETIIEDHVWIGPGTIITEGVVIGKNAVIGANSIVTENVKPYTVVAGNPIRILNDLSIAANY